jgi:putative RNA 2'-phosphotransferase
MNDRDRTKASKYLSYLLRHHPEAAGLRLGAEGWVKVDDLLAGCAKQGYGLFREDLDEIVAKCPKQRFAFSADGTQIRASQGHSIEVDLGYEAAEPPEMLFHGTYDKVLPSIWKQGLLRMQRTHVHLSSQERVARDVGARRGRPVILRVKAGEMQRAGHQFYLASNGVWLTETVPPEYLEYVN